MTIPIFAALKVTVANFTLESWINSNATDNNGNYRSLLGGELIDAYRKIFKGVVYKKIHCFEHEVFTEEISNNLLSDFDKFLAFFLK
jgi:hypothetical protein